MYFWHFLADVSCRISRASGGFAPLPSPWFCPGFVWGLKTPAPDLQLQGGHCMLCLQKSIHTSCNLQTTDSGKNISILMRKLREKWMEIIKNSGKMMLKILYEPCATVDVKKLIFWAVYSAPDLFTCKHKPFISTVLVNANRLLTYVGHSHG